ncbi:ABC transporter permease [Dethiosulfatarculus sandiegensis]|uniref:ABC transporter permease n=1 Tax=Dethiosulfatarculus sandiegensis TaxID=1429043 RepID=A0A0D2GCP4_9BACT|nr:ABC transporter permease [Dethiosulfatarculus sandiegensis]KIX12712.1 ABC transporter permease [Dethiosulfatarculus sandiegensis]
MLESIVPITLEQGFAYALVALGIALTFRVLAFPDLTVDGSFPLGGAVAAKLIVLGVDPILAALVATLAGFLAGCLTGILNTRLHINSLLSGILMMTVLYSVNLRIMGRANIQLLTIPTMFSPFEELAISRDIPVILILFLVILVTKFGLDYFLQTEYGLALRATGDNEQMIRSLGLNTDKATVFGLGLSNSLVALSGALISQDQGFADVGMGIGMIVAGLASIIIGEGLIKPVTAFRLTLAAVVGSVVYRLIIVVGLRLGLAPTDLKLATGLMVILALGIPSIRGGKQAKIHLRGV